MALDLEGSQALKDSQDLRDNQEVLGHKETGERLAYLVPKEPQDKSDQQDLWGSLVVQALTDALALQVSVESQDLRARKDQGVS